jgi:hypothetical protein
MLHLYKYFFKINFFIFFRFSVTVTPILTIKNSVNPHFMAKNCRNFSVTFFLIRYTKCYTYVTPESVLTIY